MRLRYIIQLTTTQYTMANLSYWTVAASGSESREIVNQFCHLTKSNARSGYASDITRTFPVSGTFTPPQKALYQAVLNVQKKCLALICTGSMNPAPIGQPLIGNTLSNRLSRLNWLKIGGEAANLTLPGLHRVSAQLLKEELTKIGFQFNWGESVEERLYPHLLGHAVGIDLHETDALRDKEWVVTTFQ